MLYILIQYDNIEYVFQYQNTWNLSFELFLIAFPFNIIEVKYRKLCICSLETAFDYFFFLSFLFLHRNEHLKKKNISNLPLLLCHTNFKKKRNDVSLTKHDVALNQFHSALNLYIIKRSKVKKFSLTFLVLLHCVEDPRTPD